MTIYECAKVLLGHFSPEERSIPDSPEYPGCNAAVLEAMNGALQECYGSGSPWIRWDERGAILRGPANISVATTQGSPEVQILSGWEDWMAGCTIIIEGHDVDNQIRNNSAAATLKYPYDGPTGAANATVYHDCVLLEEDVMSVHGPIVVNGREIPPRANPMLHGIADRDYGFHTDVGLLIGTRAMRTASAAGAPVAYVVETWSPDNFLPVRIRIRLAPANGERGVLDYRVMLRPPVIGDLSSIETAPVPHAFISTIFLPIARQKLMASPFWREQGGGEEIRRAYGEALVMLEKLHPAKDTGIALKPRF